MKDVIALITFFTTGERTTTLVFTGVLSCADFNTQPENSRNRAVFKERKSSVIYCIYNSHGTQVPDAISDAKVSEGTRKGERLGNTSF